MPIELRQATAADVPLILSFIRKLADFEKLTGTVAATEQSLAETLFGQRPAAEVTFAYIDGVPVGFALYFYNYSTFLGRPGIYLEDLYVDEKHRGKGAGKALLLHLTRIAKERNCGRVEWAVLDWNQRAIDFYKSLGAQPMHEWTVFRFTGPEIDKLAQEASR